MNTVIIFIDVFGVFRHKHTQTRSERISVPTVKGIIFIKKQQQETEEERKNTRTHSNFFISDTHRVNINKREGRRVNGKRKVK